MSVLRVKNIVKSYGQKRAIDDVSFDLEAGQFYALLGHNGAGKSTLMKILMRKEAPDSGEGYVFGKSFETDTSPVNHAVAYVSEDIQYQIDLPLGEFATYFKNIYENWDSAYFGRLLGLFHLNPESKTVSLSRGQKMQLCFSVALSVQPKLILVDEATAVMDPGARIIALQELHRARLRGAAILVASNIVSEVQAFTDAILLLDGGKLSFLGSPENASGEFIKFRTNLASIDPLEIPRSAVEVSFNSDRSCSYLLHKRNEGELVSRNLTRDSRSITLEETFVYFTRGRK